MIEQCLISDEAAIYAFALLCLIGGGFVGGLIYDMFRGLLVYFGVLPKRTIHLKVDDWEDAHND